MAEQTIVRAELIELKDDLSDVLAGGKRVPVQFNPETLKLAYANQIKEQNNGSSKPAAPARGANQSQGTPARQFVGAGSTKLSVQLTFDVTAASAADYLDSTGKPQSGERFRVDDVRRITAEVLYFMKPKDPGAGAKDASQRVPPGVRFLWGGFLFDGIVESLEETVEFFSADGHALRSSIALNLIQQSILVPAFSGDGRVAAPGAARPTGTTPLAPARSGQSLQQISDTHPGGGVPSPAGGGGAGPLASAAAGGGVGGVGGGTGNAPAFRAPLPLSGAAAAGGAFAGGGWQRIAVANGIENPRALAPGQYIDLSAQRPRIVTG